MWGLSTARREKGGETEARGAEERRETQPSHAGEIWETHSPQPPRRLHLEDPGWGGRAASSAPVRRPSGLQRPRRAPPRSGGAVFSGEQTFYGDAFRGEVRPPKRTGQPLIARCAPHAAGAKRPQGKDSPTS